MKIAEVISFLESAADPSLQESYDNAGLLTGQPGWECTGIICSLDATEEVVMEAVSRKCNLLVSHHPIIFGGLKKITGSNYVEKTIIAAIRHDIAIYAIHTNLDNILQGVNGKIASRLGLRETRVLAPKAGSLKKLFTFVPQAAAANVRKALFEAGAGQIGNYSECSFNSEGTGTFTGGEGTNPHIGSPGIPHMEKELKVEVIFPAWLESAILAALRTAHPYEEVAYDIISLTNVHPGVGSGIVGVLPEPMEETAFLALLKKVFLIPLIRHTRFRGKPVEKVAVCGGAGSFLISKALSVHADAFLTADLKYHEFFDANNRILLADIGHFESEQFTINLLHEILAQKFPTFAVRKTTVNTNPVQYS